MSSKFDNLCISTWNVNGLGQPIKRKKIFSILKSKQYDIVFLQETHLSAEESDKLRKDWVSQVFFSVGSSQSRGVITLINKKLQFKCLNRLKTQWEGCS